MPHTKPSKKYVAYGLTITPALPAKGETARVLYTGLLASSGADRVYVRFGFGDDWDKAMEYRMIRTDAGFEADVPVAGADSLNLCFHDSAGHWDNNSGADYSYEVLG